VHFLSLAYVDYASEDILAVAGNENELEKRIHNGRKEMFPVRLYAALEACSTSSTLFAVLRWLPHGRAFKIFDKQRFILEVLPRFFHGQRIYGSFQRQLNMYGLLKLTGQHKDHGAYYHPLLLRGRPLLCHWLVRRHESDSAVRRTFDPRSEPNFDRMPPVGNAATGLTSIAYCAAVAAAAATLPLRHPQRNAQTQETNDACTGNHPSGMSQYKSPCQNDASFGMGAVPVAPYWPDEDNETTELAITFPHSDASTLSNDSSQQWPLMQSKDRPALYDAKASTISPVDVRLYNGSSPLIQAVVVIDTAPNSMAHTSPQVANFDWSDETSLPSGRYTRDIFADQVDYPVDGTVVDPQQEYYYQHNDHHVANVLVNDEWHGGGNVKQHDVRPTTPPPDNLVPIAMATLHGGKAPPKPDHSGDEKRASWHTNSIDAAGTSTRPAPIETLHVAFHETYSCQPSRKEVNNMGIVMLVDDALAPCDRDVYQALFS
jgi:HSF-type DNA-binding